MYGCESWTIKKAKHWRIDAFEWWCWRRLLRVPWTARRSKQSILKEISPGISLEGLMLKLKLQYFGHLMRRTDSLEKTLMPGRISGRRRRGRQRIWLDGITDSIDWVWVSSGVGDGQGSLACLQSMGLQRVRHDWANSLSLSVQFSRSVVSNSLWPQGMQHARLPCPSPTTRAITNSFQSRWWCYPTISSSVLPFSSCPQSLPTSWSFPMSQFFASGSQSIGGSALASVLPVNIQDWFPLGWTGWISLQSKGLSRVFSNTTVQKHQFFCAQLSF